MPDYRAYKVGTDGHIVGFLFERTFDDDATAIAHAEQLAAEVTIEIWEGRRMVTSIAQPSDRRWVLLLGQSPGYSDLTAPAGPTLPAPGWDIVD